MPYQLKLFDIAKGTRVNYYYNRFKGFKLKSRQEVADYQNQKLRNQISFFYNNNKFFRIRLNDHNIKPSDIQEISDLKIIPPLTRIDLQNHYNEMLSPVKGKLFYSSSSGTTGTPVKYAKDVNGMSAGHAAGFCLWNLAQWDFNHRWAHIWGNPSSIKKWTRVGSRFKAKTFKQLNIPSILTNSNEGLASIVDTLKNYNPLCIEGYASSIYNLAQYINGQKIPFNRVQSVITTGESLLPYQKDIVNETIGPVSDMYGCGEINGIALKPSGHDKFYIADYHIVIETISNNDNDHKEILITDLDNKAMPFIRYNVGDLIDNIYEPDEHCELPFRYFKKLHGRSVDTISLPNGKYIQPINLLGGTLFRGLGGIIQHKVLWKNNKLIFCFVVDHNFNMENAKEKIANYLLEYQVDFCIDLVDSILPDTTGKTKYFEKID